MAYYRHLVATDAVPLQDVVDVQFTPHDDVVVRLLEGEDGVKLETEPRAGLLAVPRDMKIVEVGRVLQARVHLRAVYRELKEEESRREC